MRAEVEVTLQRVLVADDSRVFRSLVSEVLRENTAQLVAILKRFRKFAQQPA